METGVIFYEMDHPYIYEDPVMHSFHVVGADIRIRTYVLHDHPFAHPLNTPLFNPDAPYEFPLAWLHPDAPFHPFHDGPVHHQHHDEPEDQVVPEAEPMGEFAPEPEEDILAEQISLSSSESLSEEPHSISVSGPSTITSGGTSTEVIEISDDEDEDPEVIEISDDEDEDPEEYPDVIEISSDDES